MSGRGWAGATFGNGWMHTHLIRLLKHLDPRFIYWFAYIFVIPFCLIFAGSARHSYRFYRKRLRFSALKSVRHTYMNHCRFAQVVIDKFAMYAGRRFDVAIEGNEHFTRLIARKEGFLQLSAHIGNYEIAGYTLNSEKKTIHAVVYSNEKQSVMQNRSSMFVKTNVRMIALKEDMSHLFEIDKAVCDGDIVSFPADRHMEGGKCIETEFLGEKAAFPQGPFSVATMRGLEAIAMNVMKEGSKKYRIYVAPLEYDRNASRREQTLQLCRAYAAELEKMVRQYPDQWFNFFDFWAR